MTAFRITVVAVGSALLGVGLAIWLCPPTRHRERHKQSTTREEFVPVQTLQVRDNENLLLEVGVGDGLISLESFGNVGGPAVSMNVYRDGGRVGLTVQGKRRGDATVIVEDKGFTVTYGGGNHMSFFGNWVQLLKPGFVDHVHSLLISQFQPSRKRFDDVIPREALRLRNRQGWQFTSMGLTESGDPGIALADAKGVVRGVWVQRRGLVSVDPDWWEFSIFDRTGHLRVSLEMRAGKPPDLVIFADNIGGQYILHSGKLVKLEPDDNLQSDLPWLSSVETRPTRPVRLLDNSNKTLWSAP